MRSHLGWIGGSLAAAMSLVGCGSDTTQPVSPQDFYAPRSTNTTPFSPSDQPGILPVPDGQRSVAPAAKPNGNSDSISALAQGDLQSLGSAPRPATRPLAIAAASAGPTTIPVLASDQYATLGTVVAVVNGRPIYANRILRKEVDRLQARAREMDIGDFRLIARRIIEEGIGEQISDELEVAAAEHTLDPKDIELARQLTARWKKEQMNAAGGSEELARLKAKEAGDDFDDLEQQQYRSYVQGIYYERKIKPRIMITGEDERDYYRFHIAQYTTPTQAVILLIESDPANFGGDHQAAMRKLQDLRKRALEGEDFATYARAQNDLAGAAGSGGNGGRLTVQPNTLAMTRVEAQIWKLSPGQTSDVIQDGDAFYVFQVVSRQQGGVRSFADQEVQKSIMKTLGDEQFRTLRGAETDKLRSESIVYSDEHMVDGAVEMALQNYPRWIKK